MDVLAGLTVGLTVVPQALAYAEVAGLPVQVSPAPFLHRIHGLSHFLLQVWLKCSVLCNFIDHLSCLLLQAVVTVIYNFSLHLKHGPNAFLGKKNITFS